MRPLLLPKYLKITHILTTSGAIQLGPLYCLLLRIGAARRRCQQDSARTLLFYVMHWCTAYSSINIHTKYVGRNVAMPFIHIYRQRSSYIFNTALRRSQKFRSFTPDAIIRQLKKNLAYITLEKLQHKCKGTYFYLLSNKTSRQLTGIWSIKDKYKKDSFVVKVLIPYDAIRNKISQMKWVSGAFLIDLFVILHRQIWDDRLAWISWSRQMYIYL